MAPWRPNVKRFPDGGEAIFLIPEHVALRERQAHWVEACRHCGSEATDRFGYTSAGKQRYRCRVCNRTFTHGNAPPGGRVAASIVATAVNMFYESASLAKIQRQIRHDTDITVDRSTIYRWIVKYTRKASHMLGGVVPRIGSVIVADETVIKLKSYGGENVWLWDAIDRKSRFLIATYISPTRNTPEAEDFLKRVRRKLGGKTPDILLTDGLRAYLGGSHDAFGKATSHRRGDPFDKGPENTRDIERFHGTLKDRVKVLRSLADRQSAKLIIDGWTLHYNFFRAHSGIGGKTPAQMAGYKGQITSWRAVVEARDA